MIQSPSGLLNSTSVALAPPQIANPSFRYHQLQPSTSASALEGAFVSACPSLNLTSMDLQMIQPEIERVEDIPDGRRPQLAVAAAGPAHTHQRQLSRTVPVAPVDHIEEPAAGSIVGSLALACQTRSQHWRQTRQQQMVPEGQYHQLHQVQ